MIEKHSKKLYGPERQKYYINRKDIMIKKIRQQLISHFEICENQSNVIKEYIIKFKLFS